MAAVYARAGREDVAARIAETGRHELVPMKAAAPAPPSLPSTPTTPSLHESTQPHVKHFMMEAEDGREEHGDSLNDDPAPETVPLPPSVQSEYSMGPETPGVAVESKQPSTITSREIDPALEAQGEERAEMYE